MCIAVVDRLKDFLPEMAAANAELDQKIEQFHEKYDIENVSESDKQVIEMVSILLCIFLSRQYFPLSHVYRSELLGIAELVLFLSVTQLTVSKLSRVIKMVHSVQLLCKFFMV